MAHTDDMILLRDPYAGSYAHFSDAKPEDRTTAVIFVHGLLGNSVSTWWRFQRLIDEEKSRDYWSRCDLYFYRYDSFGHHVSELSERFRGFLQLVFPRPSIDSFELGVLPEIREILAPGVPVEEPKLPERYTSLLLIGHSLGGVVIRQALVDFATTWTIRSEDRTWTEPYLKASVRLFSPAIRGFQPSGVRGFLYHYAATKPVVGAIFDSLASLRELNKDSQRLADLQVDTERFAKESPWMTALSADLLYASTDIVYPGRYQCDLPQRTQPGQDHESICKPHSKYPDPLWFAQLGVDYIRRRSASS
jgi:pimeloyl-ACP methyl ester carboxylesterase